MFRRLEYFNEMNASPSTGVGKLCFIGYCFVYILYSVSRGIIILTFTCKRIPIDCIIIIIIIICGSYCCIFKSIYCTILHVAGVVGINLIYADIPIIDLNFRFNKPDLHLATFSVDNIMYLWMCVCILACIEYCHIEDESVRRRAVYRNGTEETNDFTDCHLL